MCRSDGGENRSSEWGMAPGNREAVGETSRRQPSLTRDCQSVVPLTWDGACNTPPLPVPRRNVNLRAGSICSGHLEVDDRAASSAPLTQKRRTANRTLHVTTPHALTTPEGDARKPDQPCSLRFGVRKGVSVPTLRIETAAGRPASWGSFEPPGHELHGVLASRDSDTRAHRPTSLEEDI